MIKRHWSGILQWKLSSINNGILEGLEDEGELVITTTDVATPENADKVIALTVVLLTEDLPASLAVIATE
jgi:hypothetical protein